MIQFTDADMLVGGDVRVTNPRRDQFDQVGQVIGIHKDTIPVTVEVCFDGEAHFFGWSDLALA